MPNVRVPVETGVYRPATGPEPLRPLPAVPVTPRQGGLGAGATGATPPTSLPAVPVPSAPPMRVPRFTPEQKAERAANKVARTERVAAFRKRRGRKYAQAEAQAGALDQIAQRPMTPPSPTMPTVPTIPPRLSPRERLTERYRGMKS